MRAMRVPCPKCGAPTEVLPYDHGRQIKCYDCQSMLAVDKHGDVSLASDRPAKKSAPMTYDDDNRGDSGKTRVRSGGGSTAMAVLGNVFFNLGSLVALVFFFLPVLDGSNLAHLRSTLRVGEDRVLRESRKEEKKLNDDIQDLQKELRKLAKEENKLPFDKDGQERRQTISKRRNEIGQKQSDLEEKREDLRRGNDRREKWEKDKTALEEKVDAAEVAVGKRRFWYILGMMAGFVLATIGAVCFLCTSSNRIAGAILMHAILSAVFSLALASMAGRF